MSQRTYDNPRERDEWVEFERNVPIRQPGGDEQARWTRLTGCFAKVDGVRATEQVIAEGTRSIQAYRFSVPADLIGRFCLTVVDRIKWKGRLFDIQDIPDQGPRGLRIAITARAGVNAG